MYRGQAILIIKHNATVICVFKHKIQNYKHCNVTACVWLTSVCGQNVLLFRVRPEQHRHHGRSPPSPRRSTQCGVLFSAPLALRCSFLFRMQKKKRKGGETILYVFVSTTYYVQRVFVLYNRASAAVEQKSFWKLSRLLPRSSAKRRLLARAVLKQRKTLA